MFSQLSGEDVSALWDNILVVVLVCFIPVGTVKTGKFTLE